MIHTRSLNFPLATKLATFYLAKVDDPLNAKNE